ncbi:MAG: hypothetical protein R3F61_18135 [Myxococcota bacterium]
MLAFLIALTTNAHATDPVRIRVTDPSIRTVILECGSTKLQAEVKNGMATFAQNPGKCEVLFLGRIGLIDGPAEYTCTSQGCQQVDVIHKELADASGRVTVVITDSSTTLLELKCPSGYRQRARVDTNTAVFEGVPEEDCEMFWKGGTVPAKAHAIRPATWYCQATGGTGVCTRK